MAADKTRSMPDNPKSFITPTPLRQIRHDITPCPKKKRKYKMPPGMPTSAGIWRYISWAWKITTLASSIKSCIPDKPASSFPSRFQAEDVPQSWRSYFPTKPGEVKAMYPRRKKRNETLCHLSMVKNKIRGTARNTRPNRLS